MNAPDYEIEHGQHYVFVFYFINFFSSFYYFFPSTFFEFHLLFSSYFLRYVFRSLKLLAFLLL